MSNNEKFKLQYRTIVTEIVMKKLLFAGVILPVILTGCITKPTANPEEPGKLSDNAAQSLDYAGTYRAKLSCDDCDFIAAQVQINPYGQYRYIEQKVKNNGSVGQQVRFQGQYVWDKNAPVIRLLNARNMHFFVAENQLFLLSKPISSASELTTEPSFKKVIR